MSHLRKRFAPNLQKTIKNIHNILDLNATLKRFFSILIGLEIHAYLTIIQNQYILTITYLAAQRTKTIVLKCKG